MTELTPKGEPILTVSRITVFAALCTACVLTAGSARADLWGAGIGGFTKYAVKDSVLSDYNVQPTVWASIPYLHTQAACWAVVPTAFDDVDDIVLDTRTGAGIGTWGWLGITTHSSLRQTETGRKASVELGGIFTWFTPPYRPTLSAGYDIAQRKGPFVTARVPYTIRAGWLPPTTFIPELCIHFETFRPSPVYLSFTAMLERRIGWLLIVPIAAVVVPSGQNLKNWIIWGGLHLGAIQ